MEATVTEWCTNGASHAGNAAVADYDCHGYRSVLMLDARLGYRRLSVWTVPVT